MHVHASPRGMGEHLSTEAAASGGSRSSDASLTSSSNGSHSLPMRLRTLVSHAGRHTRKGELLMPTSL
jgi:hypothetical protein